MTTIPKSVKTQLDTDWTGAGGAKPTYYLQEEDFRTPPPLGEDSVWIMSKSLDTDGSDVVNDTFVDEKHVLTLIVNTSKVSGGADRLKELSDEVVRILNATRVADITYQRMRGRTREVTQNQGVWVYQEVIVYNLREDMKSSAAAYGAGATGDFVVTGDILSSTSFSHEEALMLGSANAAWIPCPLEGGADMDEWEMDSNGRVTNTGGGDTVMFYAVPLTPLKGSLKLHISGTRISLSDADANDYVATTAVRGFSDTGLADLDVDATDKNTAALHEDTFTAVDCSSYGAIKIRLVNVCTDANDLDIQYVTVRAYYAT